MSRSLKLSLPGLGLVAVTLCVSGACSVAPGQDERPDPAVTIAEQGGPPVGVATAQTSAAESRHTWDLSARSPAEQRIERALDDPQGVDIEFVDQPLKDAMEYTNDAHGITILLDEKALQDDDIQTDEPLNYVLSGITLRSALNIMLDPLGLTYLIEDEVLKITTSVVADERLVTRVYDVRRLGKAGLDSIQLARAIAVAIDPETWGRVEPKGTVSGGSRGPQDAEKRADEPSRRHDTGLAALDGALVVTHNQHVHRRIVELLDQLGRFADRTTKE